MKLTEINIYPVKSMGSISLQEATVLPAGLQYDRRWLLVDENGVFLTQRNLPEMALVNFIMKENGFEAYYKGGDFGRVHIPLDIPPNALWVTAQVWDDRVQSHVVNKEVNEWFSEVFNRKCALIRIRENAVRISKKGEPDKISSFADITPFLIIGEESLNNLNSRMETPIPMSRFRPNFVFSGGNAFCEDEWDEFKIGNIYFKKYKKCGRCKVTTIDQETGIKMGEEPLETLSKYRKEDQQLNFGVRAFLAAGQDEGVIRVNDPVINTNNHQIE